MDKESILRLLINSLIIYKRKENIIIIIYLYKKKSETRGSIYKQEASHVTTTPFHVTLLPYYNINNNCI